jgi:hypothetical protein
MALRLDALKALTASALSLVEVGGAEVEVEVHLEAGRRADLPWQGSRNRLPHVLDDVSHPSVVSVDAFSKGISILEPGSRPEAG